METCDWIHAQLDALESTRPQEVAPYSRVAVDRVPCSGPAVLVLVAKLPIPGKCKTRLAAKIGDENAADFSRMCIFDLATSLSSAGGHPGL